MGTTGAGATDPTRATGGAGATGRAAGPHRRFDPVTRGLVLALPIAFLAHDLGEVRGNDELNEAIAEIAARSPFLSRVAPAAATTDRQMAGAVAALTAACVAVSVRAVRRPDPGRATAQFAAATALAGGHIAGHVAQSVMLRRRMPGLGGGLAVTVPYSVIVLSRLHRRGFLDTGKALRTAGLGVAALGPVLLTLRLLSRRFL